MPGFIPFSRASLMMDVVALAMFAVVPVLLWSIYIVAYRRRYELHRKTQLWLGGLLLVAVVLFELDVRLHGWRQNALASPYYANGLNPVLYVHLFFAVSTCLLWIYTIIGAIRRFPKPAAPGAYGSHHRRVAKVAAVGMCLTAVTGWTFYWMAFIA